MRGSNLFPKSHSLSKVGIRKRWKVHHVQPETVKVHVLEKISLFTTSGCGNCFGPTFPLGRYTSFVWSFAFLTSLAKYVCTWLRIDVSGEPELTQYGRI